MNIKEVEKRVGMSSKNIRFYEEEGLLKVPRNKENGYREFHEACILQLQEIKMFRGLGISLEDIRKYQHHELSVKEMMEHRLKEIEETSEITQRMKEMCRKMKDSETPLVPYMVDECNTLMQSQDIKKPIPKMDKKQMKVRTHWASLPFGMMVWMLSSVFLFPKMFQLLAYLSIISNNTASIMESGSAINFIASLILAIFSGVLLNLFYGCNREKYFIMGEAGIYYIDDQNKVSKVKMAWSLFTKHATELFDYLPYEEIYSVEPGLRVVGAVGMTASKVFEHVFRIGTTNDEYIILSCGTAGQGEDGISLLSQTLAHYAKVVKDPYKLMKAYKLSDKQYYVYLNKVFDERLLYNQEHKENNSLWDF